MTADQIIHEIKILSPEEQARVIRFAYRLDAERQLTDKELAALAGRMVTSTDSAEAAMLREAIVRGFYGEAFLQRATLRSLSDSSVCRSKDAMNSVPLVRTP